MEPRRAAILLSLASLLALLAWWLTRRLDPPAAERATLPVPPVAEPRLRAPTPPPAPAVHLPQLRAGPGDEEAEPSGPTNIPPGTPRARLAASGKLAFTVIEEYAESFRACFEEHRGEDPDLPEQALLEFTIRAEPRDAGEPFGTVSQVQVLTGGADYEGMEHSAFESCCAEAVVELELDPPGGRAGGQARFGLTIDLIEGEIVGAPKGPIQAE
jgi:hypothetical protein